MLRFATAAFCRGIAYWFTSNLSEIVSVYKELVEVYKARIGDLDALLQSRNREIEALRLTSGASTVVPQSLVYAPPPQIAVAYGSAVPESSILLDSKPRAGVSRDDS